MRASKDQFIRCFNPADHALSDRFRFDFGRDSPSAAGKTDGPAAVLDDLTENSLVIRTYHEPHAARNVATTYKLLVFEKKGAPYPTASHCMLRIRFATTRTKACTRLGELAPAKYPRVV